MFLTKQEAINETLCSENTIGRWYTENKRNQSGELLWLNSSINTCPDNFLWNEQNPQISVLNPGCYEISLGFHSEKKPIFQVYVNNELAFSLVNCAS